MLLLVGMLLGGLAAVAAELGHPEAITEVEEPAQRGTPAEEGAVRFELRVGDCLDDVLRDVQVVDAEHVVPCESPHDFEVYAVTDLAPGQPYPGSEETDALANQFCLRAFEDFTGTAYQDSPLDFVALVPDAAAWEAEDPRVFCLLYDLSGVPLRGSARAPAT